MCPVRQNTKMYDTPWYIKKQSNENLLFFVTINNKKKVEIRFAKKKNNPTT